MQRALIAFALTGAGCVGPGARAEPSATVADLALALRAGDPAAIASVTGRPEDEARAALDASGRELSALGATLGAGSAEVGARVTLADGTVVALVREGESWRVDRGVLGRPALARPVDAVIALHDALARSRLPAVLALLARAPRAELEGELARWIAGTADPDALEISVQGEAATARTPTGEVIDLVRESGEWRVVELR